MPLNLNPLAREQLQDKLADALRSLRVNNGMFIDYASTEKVATADSSLPQTGKLRDQLVEYIDEFPLTDFVTETIGQELVDLDRYVPDQTTALTDIARYADFAAVAKRLLDDFESLPWAYEVTIPLPETLTKLVPPELDTIPLGPMVRIVRPTAEFMNRFPMELSKNPQDEPPATLSLLAALYARRARRQPAKWDAGRVYIQISALGFIGRYGGSGTAHKVERVLRSFCGLGIATRLFNVKYTAPSQWKTSAYVHRKGPTGDWLPAPTYELNDAIDRGLAALELHDLDGSLDTELKRNFWIADRLRDIATVYQSGTQSDQITLASQWHFDSFTTHDHMLAFVQMMVVLEIILGDKSISDEIGIGALISNRFAYLVGTTHEERAELIAEFRKIYSVRSQIVHSGKHKLSHDEYRLYARLRWMCRRIIAKEVDLLKSSSAVGNTIT